MLKLTRTGIGLLTRQYRSVLHKCWLINVGLWQAMGDAVSKAVSVPARLVASLMSGGVLNGEAFNVLDEILLTRLFERKLASLTAIGLGIAAATMPTEAEAGVLCYDYSTGMVKYTINTTCPSDASTRLISLDGIDNAYTIGTGSTALGNNAKATSNYSTALGNNAQATGNNSTALGASALATLNNSTALGASALATLDNSTALGSGAIASGINSTAVGSAQATGGNSVALGYAAKATQNYAMALGNNAQATGEHSIAIGYKSIADEANTVSFGRFGADSATLDQMREDIDVNKMSQTDFTTKYTQYGTKASMLYMYYTMLHFTWENAVETTNIAGIYHRITNVADAVNAHDAVTLGQLQNNYYTNHNKKDKNSDKYITYIHLKIYSIFVYISTGYAL